jgi:aspartyl-tRNA(Asn)/glutamyl-tRNA(Gln) amidotransferase subunit C
MPDKTTGKIDEKTLEALLYLSRLSGAAIDVDTLRRQANEIVGYFDVLSHYDDSENPYDAYPTVTAEDLRDNRLLPPLENQGLKAMSEEFLDGYFRVPKVLGEGV